MKSIPLSDTIDTIEYINKCKETADDLKFMDIKSSDNISEIITLVMAKTILNLKDMVNIFKTIRNIEVFAKEYDVSYLIKVIEESDRNICSELHHAVWGEMDE